MVSVASLTIELLNKWTVQEAAKARKDSYASANPLALGGGGTAIGSRGNHLRMPLEWIADRLTNVGGR